MMDLLRDGYTSLGPKYGVDPLVFAAIDVGSIPVFVAVRTADWVPKSRLRTAIEP